MPEIIIIATKQCQAYSSKKKTQASKVNLMYITSALICTNQTKLDNASRLNNPKPVTIVMPQYTSCSVAVKIEAKTPAKPIRWTVRNDIFNQRLPLKLGIIDKGLHTLHNKFQTEH